MNMFVLAGSVLAILTYLPLWKQVRSGEVKQSLLTWVLWAILDALVALTIIVQNGNFLLPTIYIVGSAVTAFLIYKSGTRASWTWFESFIVFLVFVTMVVWRMSTDKAATIASTAAVVIAGIPQLIDAWKKPNEMPMAVFSSYFVANMLSAAGGKDWSIEERLYPFACAVLCLLIILCSVRKFWISQSCPATLDKIEKI